MTEVFLTYVKRAEAVRDVRGWLLGAICHASRHYWRKHGRDVESDDHFDRVDPTSSNILESLPDQTAAREALRSLEPSVQEVLRLRYFEQLSLEEIAERKGLTLKYTQRLITKSLRKAERVYHKKERERRESISADSALGQVLADFVDAYKHI